MHKIEYLPTRLHFSFTTDVDVKAKQEQILQLFPNTKENNYEDDILILVDPVTGMEFIHVSSSEIGAIISSDEPIESDLNKAWMHVVKILNLFKVNQLTSYQCQFRFVYQFENEDQRIRAIRMLSPLNDYEANELTLYPVDKAKPYLVLSSVKKDSGEEGLSFWCVWNAKKDKSIDISLMPKELSKFASEHDKPEQIEEIIKKITA